MRVALFLVFLTCHLTNFSLYSEEVQETAQSADIKQMDKQSPSQENNTTQAPQTKKKNLSKLEQTKNKDNDKENSEKRADKDSKKSDKDSSDQKSKSAHKLTATVAFLSDYRSRGISQTFRRPAVQGEIKYVHLPSGFYFKSWGSNVDGTGNLLNNTSMEWDLFLGISHPLFDSKANYDIGFLYYYYPGGRAKVPANTRYDTLEYYISANYKGLEVKLSLTLTDYFADTSSNPPQNWDKNRFSRPSGSSYGSAYLETNLDVDLCPKLKASFHLGYQKVTNYSRLNYLDWLVSLTREFEWFEVNITYVATNANKTFYKVPDNSFKPHRVNLGGAGITVGIDRTF